VATLGKAFGVNGGYISGSDILVRLLRQTSPFYVYSNPITPAEAEAALAAIAIVNGPRINVLLAHLRAMARRFRHGLAELGLETLAGQHPVLPLLVRDGEHTARIVAHLRGERILATGLNYPVVAKGDEEIRFQISADHTPATSMRSWQCCGGCLAEQWLPAMPSHGQSQLFLTNTPDHAWSMGEARTKLNPARILAAALPLPSRKQSTQLPSQASQSHPPKTRWASDPK
jgi:Aminotransferase class I and II